MQPFARHALKILAALSGIVGVTPFVARWIGRRMFAERVGVEVRQLLTAAIDGSDAVVTDDDLDGLPAPVQRYLRFAGVVGRPRIRTARLTQRGSMRVAPGQPWQPVAAEEHFAVFPLGYIWHATVASGLFSVEIRDAYFAGYGEVLARLASFVPVAEARGPEVDEGALVRYLSETVFFPTVLVDQVRWEPIDDESARVFLSDDELEVSAICTFDSRTGRMVNLVAERWRDEDGYFHKHVWSAPFEEYAEFNGFMIPSESAAIWHLDDEEFEYARFEVTDAEFDVEPSRVARSDSHTSLG